MAQSIDICKMSHHEWVLFSSGITGCTICDSVKGSATRLCTCSVFAAADFSLSATNFNIFFLGPRGSPMDFKSSSEHMSWQTLKRKYCIAKKFNIQSQAVQQYTLNLVIALDGDPDLVL